MTAKDEYSYGSLDGGRSGAGRVRCSSCDSYCTRDFSSAVFPDFYSSDAAVSGCQYGKSCDPSGSCFDLCTEVWNRICLACRTGRLACKLSDLLCGAQKIMAENSALNKHSAQGVFALMLKEENWSTAKKSERYRGSGNIQP